MITHPFNSSFFNDKRLANRANSVLTSMTSKGSSVINRIYSTITEKIAAYRMINNEKVSCSSIVDAYREACQKTVKATKCSHILCLQDTCEINYEAHSLRMHKKGRKPGCVSHEETGCFFHPTLAIDADTLVPCGFSSIKMWNREEGAKNCIERSYKKLSPEEKESFRWSEAIDSTKDLLGGKVNVTMLSDRESDVYEVLKRADHEVKLIVRSNQNRRIRNHDTKLHDMMRALASLGTYEFPVPASHGRKARLAKMEVRFTSVELERPAGTKVDSDAHIKLNCICVTETNESVPHGNTPIEWILLTNHEVTNVQQALQCVNWYKCRWFIEELFRLLKKKGFAIEDIQLEDTECLEKNILFAAYAAMRCIELKHAFNNHEYYRHVAASICFETDEIEAAKLLLKKINGKTAKQQNPYSKGSLAWMAWIIARLGCWTGYITQSKPGYTTFKRGLDKLQQCCEMYRIMKDVYKG